jgi:hypothetical protein
MTPDFRITQGNRPKITDTLSDDAGPVDLTGCTVRFIFQRDPTVSFSKAAIVTVAAAGTVEYTLAAGESDAIGLYQAQWEITTTSTGIKRTFPTGSLNDDDTSGRYITFEIVPALPIIETADATPVWELRETVRAFLGDFDAAIRRYQDSAIDSVVRGLVRAGALTGYALTNDRLGIAPAIIDPKAFGLLTYKAVKAISLPNVGSYSYRTRALSETFGRQTEFLFALETAIYENENADMFSSMFTFYTWVNSITGVNLWALLSDMKVSAPVMTVSVGRGGIIMSPS